MIKGIIVRPGKTPEVIEFPEGYKELQRLVEGNFEMPYLFDDVDIVVNEEGKFNGSDPKQTAVLQGTADRHPFWKHPDRGCQ